MKWFRVLALALVVGAALAVSSSALAANRTAATSGSCQWSFVRGASLTATCNVNGASYTCTLAKAAPGVTLDCAGGGKTLSCSLSFVGFRVSCVPPIPVPPHDE
jgi:hypothetical protein